MATENQQLTAGQRVDYVLASLRNAISEIEPFLDVPFDKFLATVRQALVNNPDILRCTAASIIRSCIKAAHDGLRIDGREAALVKHSVKVSKNPDRWEDRAEYFPMVFGIVQQILNGGEVIAMESEVVREHDEFEVRRGTDPGIHHRPDYTKPDRGEIIAAYSVASLKSGVKTFEVVDRSDLARGKAAAKTDYVWKAWPGEMSRKFVVRRHRKMLPLGDRDIVDVEEREMFGADDAPAQIGATPPVPTRAAIAHAGEQIETGDLIDSEGDVDGVVVDQRQREAAKPRQQRKAADKTVDKAGGPPAEIPEDEDSWRTWAVATEDEIIRAESADAVGAIAKREEERLAAASKLRADHLRGVISDRLADFVTGGSSGNPSGEES